MDAIVVFSLYLYIQLYSAFHDIYAEFIFVHIIYITWNYMFMRVVIKSSIIQYMFSRSIVEARMAWLIQANKRGYMQSTFSARICT